MAVRRLTGATAATLTTAGPAQGFWIVLSVLLLLAAASQARAWTLFYDGFNYSPPSQGGYGSPPDFKYYKYDASAYQLGDPALPYPVLNHPTSYPPSAWVAAATTSTVGYWPYIIGYDLTSVSPPTYTPTTARSVKLYGTASNDGKCVRCSPVNLRQTPPSGPFPAITRGKLYYSIMVWSPECVTTTATPGVGEFYVGFNHEPPASTSPQVQAGTAGARLRLRRAQGDGIGSAFQIGIQANEPSGSNATLVWEHPNPYVSHIGGENSTPVFVVVCYEFVDGTDTDDICRLWVNPSSATFGDNGLEPAPTVTTSGGDMTNSQIQSFFIRQCGSAGTANKMARVVFDELRIGVRWADVTSTVAPGDFDNSTHIDNDDLTAFIECVSGPTIAHPAGCEDKDLDLDTDVDQDDFGILQACYTGPNAPINPYCAVK